MTTHDGPMEWPHMEQYSDIPMFNTKAVVQQTGVPAPTLRAWERRYALVAPERANNAYRLYSERDIALIRWLKERIDSGMSISQAIALFRHLNEIQQDAPVQNETPDQVSTESHSEVSEPPFQIAVNLSIASRGLAVTSEQQGSYTHTDVPPAHPITPSTSNGMQAVWNAYPTPHNMRIVRSHLIDAFQNLDEQTVHMMMGSMLALYSVEQVCNELISPTLWEIGRLWAEGSLTVSVEHFASNFFRALLINIFHVTPGPVTGPLVLTCCAPGEPHELPILMLSLFLRRKGIRVAYLGQSIETTGLLHTVKKLMPAMVCVSLTIPSYLPSLVNLARLIQNIPENRPILAFGGQAFAQFPQSAEVVPGEYVQGDLSTLVQKIHSLLFVQSTR